MFSFILTVAVFAIVAYAIYTSYFGEVKGDHVSGINAMIFVENDLAAKKILDDQKKASIKRTFAEAAA